MIMSRVTPTTYVGLNKQSMCGINNKQFEQQPAPIRGRAEKLTGEIGMSTIINVKRPSIKNASISNQFDIEKKTLKTVPVLIV